MAVLFDTLETQQAGPDGHAAVTPEKPLAAPSTFSRRRPNVPVVVTTAASPPAPRSKLPRGTKAHRQQERQRHTLGAMFQECEVLCTSPNGPIAPVASPRRPMLPTVAFQSPVVRVPTTPSCGPCTCPSPAVGGPGSPTGPPLPMTPAGRNSTPVPEQVLALCPPQPRTPPLGQAKVQMSATLAESESRVRWDAVPEQGRVIKSDPDVA